MWYIYLKLKWSKWLIYKCVFPLLLEITCILRYTINRNRKVFQKQFTMI